MLPIPAAYLLIALASAVSFAESDDVDAFAQAMMRELSVQAMDCSARSIVLDDSGTSTRIDGSSLPDVAGLAAGGMRARCGYRLHTDRARFRSLWDGRLRGEAAGATALPEGPREDLGEVSPAGRTGSVANCSPSGSARCAAGTPVRR